MSDKSTWDVEIYTMIAAGMSREEAIVVKPSLDRLVEMGIERDSAMLVVAKCAASFGASADDVVRAVDLGVVRSHPIGDGGPAQEMAAAISLHAVHGALAGLTVHDLATAIASMTAERGISISDAGHCVRKSLLDMVKPTLVAKRQAVKLGVTDVE